MSAAWAFPVRRELARRTSGGIEVTLYWTKGDNTTSIEIWHASSEELLAFDVAPEEALDAFRHPFAHLAHSGADSPLSLHPDVVR